MKKALILWLCLCMLLSLAGCGAGDADGTQEMVRERAGGEPVSENEPAAPPDGEYTYVMSFHMIDVPYREFLCGNTLYYEEPVYDSKMNLTGYEFWSLDLDTLKPVRLERGLDDREYIEGLVLLNNSEMVRLTSTYDGEAGGHQYFLVFHDAAGAQIGRYEITKQLYGGGKWDEEDLYPVSMAADGRNHIYVMLGGMSTVIHMFDTHGNLEFSVEESGHSVGLYRNESGEVFCIGDKQTIGARNTVLRRLDAAAGDFAETWEGLPAQVDLACFDGEDTILISSDNALYRYHMTDQSREVVLNWLNMSMAGSNLELLASFPDGRIMALNKQYDRERDEQQMELAVLTRVPASETAQKTAVTFGTLKVDYYISEQILAFNRSNEACQIQVKEYGDDETGRMQLRADLLSGKGPDILDLDAVSSEAAIARGLLTDLYPLMEQCPDTDKADFLPSVLSIYERDGRLYGIVPGFMIDSLMGKVSVVGEQTGWTVSDVQALCQSRPGTQLIRATSREDVMRMMLSMGMEDFIDWSSGVCSFDSEEFMSLLEFCSMLPPAEEADYEDDFMERLASGQLLLTEMHTYDVASYQLHAAFFAGEPVNCIGYPSPDGRGTLLEPRYSLAILEACPHKQEAWEFISWLLADEFQSSAWGYLPVRESSLQEVFDKAMETESHYSYNSLSFELPAATPEDIAAVRRMIDTGKGASMADGRLLQIVEEEAAAYFAGQKTAEDVAKIIQSRAQLYVDENR